MGGRERDTVGMKLYLYGPVDEAKTLELRFRVGDLESAEKKDEYQ